MSLLHALVARGTVVLAESGGPASDRDIEAGSVFHNATSTILRKIPPGDSKLSYAAEDYLFHYIRKGPQSLTVLCMADQDLPRRVAFAFLNELMKRLTASYTASDLVSAEHLSLTATFNGTISRLMKQFTDNPPIDPVRQAQQEIDGTKQIMVQNIEAILSRGERIELLVDKTDQMSHNAKAFRKRSQALRRRMWWKNTKLIALTSMVVLLLLFLLIYSFRSG